MDDYDFKIVMHASDLEDGMIFRTKNGTEYAITIHRISDTLLRVEVPFGSITYHIDSPDNAFLSSFEDKYDWDQWDETAGHFIEQTVH